MMPGETRTARKAAIAFLCGRHPRCGASSLVRLLSGLVARDILEHFDGLIEREPCDVARAPVHRSDPRRIELLFRIRLFWPILIGQVTDGTPVLVVGRGVIYELKTETESVCDRAFLIAKPTGRDWQVVVELATAFVRPQGPGPLFFATEETVVLFDRESGSASRATWVRLVDIPEMSLDTLAPPSDRRMPSGARELVADLRALVNQCKPCCLRRAMELLCERYCR